MDKTVLFLTFMNPSPPPLVSCTVIHCHPSSADWSPYGVCTCHVRVTAPLRRVTVLIHDRKSVRSEISELVHGHTNVITLSATVPTPPCHFECVQLRRCGLCCKLFCACQDLEIWELLSCLWIHEYSWIDLEFVRISCQVWDNLIIFLPKFSV